MLSLFRTYLMHMYWLDHVCEEVGHAFFPERLCTAGRQASVAGRLEHGAGVP